MTNRLRESPETVRSCNCASATPGGWAAPVAACCRRARRLESPDAEREGPAGRAREAESALKFADYGARPNFIATAAMRRRWRFTMV